jgi:hypothetical protein
MYIRILTAPLFTGKTEIKNLNNQVNMEGGGDSESLDITPGTQI